MQDHELIYPREKGVNFWDAILPIAASVPVSLSGFGLIWLLDKIVSQKIILILAAICLVVIFSSLFSFFQIRKAILESELSKLSGSKLKSRELAPVVSYYFAKHNTITSLSLVTGMLGIVGMVALSNFFVFSFDGIMFIKSILITSFSGLCSLIFFNVMAVSWAEKKYLKVESIFRFFDDIDERTVRVGEDGID